MPSYPIGPYYPQIDPDSYIAPGVVLVGQVIVKKGASLWFNTVIRADCGFPITIGEYANIQDNAVIHTDYWHPAEIGSWVTVGHGAVIHSARIGDYCLIGIGTIILDNVVIGEHSVVGANTLVPEGREFPPYSLIVGNPGKLVKTLTPEQAEKFKGNAKRYETLWRTNYKGKIE